MSSVNPFNPGEYNTCDTQQCPNASHMALCFVLDRSYSMDGEPIRALNEGMRLFKEMACNDNDTCSILDVAVIAFNHEFEVLQNFRSIEDLDLEAINLVADGGTRFAPPMNTAIRMVKDRTKFYKDFAPPYKPWIVLVTDGKLEPHESEDDFERVVEELRLQQASNKLAVRTLGVHGYDPQTLHLLSDYPRTDGKPGWYKNVLKLNGYDFTDFFNWAIQSMAAISHSSPGQAVPPASLRRGGSVAVDQYDLSDMG